MERGFTLLELMVTAAIVAILAVIVVPSFFREGRKVKAESEVVAMFAELTTRLEQQKLEHGAYVDLAACPPAVPSGNGIDASLCRESAAWVALRINPPTSTLRCSYEAVSGVGTESVLDPLGFTWESPETGWYYVTATCDTDGNAGTNALFFASSTDPTIRKQHEAN